MPLTWPARPPPPTACARRCRRRAPPAAAPRVQAASPHVYRLQPHAPRVQAATACVQVATACVQAATACAQAATACVQVPPRVHAQLPRAAVVLVLRNEIDRAASHYARCRYKVGACFGLGSGCGFGLEGHRVRLRGLEGQGWGQWTVGRGSGQGQWLVGRVGVHRCKVDATFQLAVAHTHPLHRLTAYTPSGPRRAGELR